MGGVANKHVVYWSFLPSDSHIIPKIPRVSQELSEGWVKIVEVYM